MKQALATASERDSDSQEDRNLPRRRRVVQPGCDVGALHADLSPAPARPALVGDGHSVFVAGRSCRPDPRHGVNVPSIVLEFLPGVSC